MSLFWSHQAKRGYGTDTVSDIDTTGLVEGTQYTDTALLQTYIWNGTTWEPLTGAYVAPLPGGSDTEVQFNNAGVLDGASDFTWDETNDRLTLNALLDLPIRTSSPATTVEGDLWLVRYPQDAVPIGLLLALTYSHGNPPLRLFVNDGVAIRSIDFGEEDTGNVDRVVSVTTSYTVTALDDNVLASATGGDITLTLPPATGLKGKTFWLKRTDTASTTVVVVGTGGDTIDDAASQIISEYDSMKVISDGTEWWIT